jgi:parallel beta helix pectate lyase-like protein
MGPRNMDTRDIDTRRMDPRTTHTGAVETGQPRPRPSGPGGPNGEPPLTGWRRLVKERQPLVYGIVALLLVIGTAAVVLTFNRSAIEGTSAARPGTDGDGAAADPSASAGDAASESPSASPSAGASTSAAAPTTTRPNTGGGVGPPAPGQSKCVASPSSCGLPDASNTGVPSGVALSNSGSISVDTPGALISGLNISGCVTVTAPGVTIKNTRITGNCTYAVQTSGGADASGAARLTIQDSEISCGNQPLTGVGDNNLTLLRVEISGCENGLDIDNHVTVQDSYIHNLVTCCGAHTDGAQLNARGTDITFLHNSILSAAPGGTSAIIMHTEEGNSHVLVQNNLLAGGAYILYCPRVPSDDIRVVGNRFGPAGEGSGGAAYGATDGCNGIADFSGNIWDATGKAVTP